MSSKLIFPSRTVIVETQRKKKRKENSSTAIITSSGTKAHKVGMDDCCC